MKKTAIVSCYFQHTSIVKQLLTSDKIREIVNAVPDDWLNWTDGQETPQDLRDIYIQFLEERINHSETFVNEAQNARKALI